jgi:hypothetical protein
MIHSSPSFSINLMQLFKIWGFHSGDCCRLHPPAHAGSSVADFSNLNMETIRSSETSDHSGSTQCHISEDGILHNPSVVPARFWYISAWFTKQSYVTDCMGYTFRSRKPRLTAVGIRCADHATPSTRKGRHYLSRQAAIARSVEFASGLRPRSLVFYGISFSNISDFF